MPWRCFLISDPESVRARVGRVPVGAMWPAPWLLDPEHGWGDYVAPNYRRDWAATRPPYFVKLPDGSEFCIDSRATSGGRLHGDGWTVTGAPPNVTLTPSINVVGYYHGWIQNGVITDDCEGRTFPPR